ncbi:MAG: PD40 domain-containing protein, partial [Anaerolineaceae bacterium]|nr:PD40 domain-containing protein [Anaerolineaceae bacterium]
DNPDVSAVRAILDKESLAFSPDGRQLAFMGAIDGPTSDLYLYSLESGKLLQLTDGRTQGYQPVWSPDGKYILHTGAEGFGTGAGFETKGVWTAQADKDSVKTLYTPTPNAAEMIVGWVDDETFVVYSWSQPCGPNNLRTYNVESKKSTVLWSEPFSSIALDPTSDTIVLTSSEESCAPEDGVGTYFIPVFGGNPQKVGEDTGPIVVWSSAGRIFLVSGGDQGKWTLGVDTLGQIVNIDWPSGGFYYPVISPGSNYLFWSGTSPHIGSMDNTIPTTEYFNESIQKAIWTPDGQAVIFIAESGLYIAHQPGFEAILISPDIQLKPTYNYMEWLIP